MSPAQGHERLNELRVVDVHRLLPVLGNEPIVNLSEVLLSEGREAPRGCMVLTPTRLILAELGPLSFKTTVHPWSRVSSIQLEIGPLSATVRLASPSGPTVLILPFDTRGRWDGLSAHFHQALADGFSASPAPSVHPVAATPTPSFPPEVDCPYCGARNDAAEKKCSSCAAALPRPSAAAPAPAPGPPPAAAPAGVAQPAESMRIPWVVWLVGGLMGLFGLMLVVLSRPGC